MPLPAQNLVIRIPAFGSPSGAEGCHQARLERRPVGVEDGCEQGGASGPLNHGKWGRFERNRLRAIKGRKVRRVSKPMGSTA
jgi:hypothetical protein